MVTARLNGELNRAIRIFGTRNAICHTDFPTIRREVSGNRATIQIWEESLRVADHVDHLLRFHRSAFETICREQNSEPRLIRFLPLE